MIYRPLSRNVAVFGDSRTANGFSGTLPNKYIEAYGYACWMNFYSEGKHFTDHDFNFGVGGDTTIQMLARITPVLDSTADLVVFLGGTNDYTDSNGIDAGTTIQNIKHVIRLLRNKGKVVCIVADTPRGGADGNDKLLTAAQFNKQLAVRKWILEQAPNMGAVVADPWPELVNPDGKTARTGTMHDGLHPSPIGAEIIGRHVAAAIAPFFEGSLVLPETNATWNTTTNPYGNLFANGLLVGTGAAISGTVNAAAGSVLAPSWAVAGGTFTGVTTELWKEPEPDGFGEVQCVRLRGNATTTGANFVMSQSLTLANLAAGNKIKTACKIETDGATSGLLNLGMDLRFTISSVTYGVRANDKYIDTTPLPNKDLKGFLEVPQYTYVGTETLFQPRILIYLTPGVELNTVVKISRLTCFKEPV